MRLIVPMLLLMLLPAWPAAARTKLVALPERETTVVRLDNPTATLVEEERVLALEAGENQVDFSWQGVRIDADSIRLAVLDRSAGVQLLAVAYPPGEEALVWTLQAQRAGEVKVRISYLLAALDRLVTYQAVTDSEESHLDLQAFLVLRNFSGEDFAAAGFQLGQGSAATLPLAHEETRRQALFSAKGVPVVKTFTWDSVAQPWDPKRDGLTVGIPVHYRVANTAAANLGQAPLWGGKVRVFQVDGHGGTIYLGEDQGEFTPVGEDLKLYVGDSRDVAVTQHKVREEVVNPRPSRALMVLHDTEEELAATVENFKERAVTLDLVEHIDGEWEVREVSHPYERYDAGTLIVHVPLAAGATEQVKIHYQRRNVRN